MAERVPAKAVARQNSTRPGPIRREDTPSEHDATGA
jgi:hypothetical protein